MLNHITLKVSDLEKSKKFFLTALAPLGYKIFMDKPTSVGFGQVNIKGHSDFWIKQGEPGERHSLSCIAFSACNRQTVDDFYKAALQAGGKDNGAPGYRLNYHAGYYAAFIIGPDGYNIEAVFEDLDKLKSGN